MNRVDLLFDARCYRMSGIGRYIKGELSALGFNIQGASPETSPQEGAPSTIGLLCNTEEIRSFSQAGIENLFEWGARPFSFSEQFLSSGFLRKALKKTDTV
jgi:NADH:ubiquinone oxidoreductase subunit F (NADH-binding)